MSGSIDINNSVFECIKHVDENGNEFWYAREFQKVLKYGKWDKFCNVINQAMIACQSSKNS